MKVLKQNNRQVFFEYLGVALLLFWCVPTFSFGMSNIKADDTDFDLSKGEFTAKGNVKIDSEEVTLSADEVQATVKGTQLLSITATGKPLELELEIDNEEEEPQTISASAEELTFDNEANWIEFVGDVQLQTEVAKIRAHKIRIELDTQKIVATKGEDTEQVEITLLDEESP
ncbi:MAG: hypothetical protein F4227_07005 [Gammaproteobacteria bacterium]|nr:hypothetical protein [Gammaproteobacteria bacterium]MYF02706.1 hypothetical protein [Gammaproteobacteria bacterium]MYI77015.1 hypothetical protein [Gammaproteobacteria bacterium]